MTAVKYNIVLEQGVIFQFTARARNSDKSIIDLTGYSGRMQIRPSVTSTTIYLDATTANNMIAIDGLTGTVVVTIGADVTSAMTWTAGVYDLEVYNSVSNVLRLAEGYAYLSPEVTR